jgi:hypothetical protein
MLINTSTLIGPALDWAVAKAEGLAVSEIATKWRNEHAPHAYSTDPALAYPIIEREKITTSDALEAWAAGYNGTLSVFGPTLLIAAMRCYVARKLGETIDIPDWLI